MKYSLDILDRLNIYDIGTVLENNPTYRVFLDENIQEDKLVKAINEVLIEIPYLKTQLAFDGKYYLLENTNDLKLYHCKFEDRPLLFGKESNNYMFQITYYKNEIIFDWSHIANDGLGFLQVVNAIIKAYYNQDCQIDKSIYDKLPCSDNLDSKSHKNYLIVQQDGFSKDRIKFENKVGKAKCTTLVVPSKQVLNYRNRADATPGAVVSALIAQTLRNHLKTDSIEDDNNNIKCKIVVTTRKTLNIETLHNCYLNLFVTYTNAFDKFNFEQICSFYRTYIDLANEEDTILLDIQKQKESLDKIENNTLKQIKKQAIEKRNKMCNFNFSYLGVLPFQECVMKHIKDFQAICINENSEFGVFAYSFNENIYLTICENYIEDIVKEFIDYGKSKGIYFDLIDRFEYQQANFSLPELNVDRKDNQ